MNKKMSKRQKDIKSKLMAAICMLLVSSIMMVSSTYAWFTLSTAPEVTGIQTAVGANGNLEMALQPYSGDLATILSSEGDSLKLPAERNITWGNLVDVSDNATYGMNNLVLYPAALNVTDSGAIGDQPLKTPVYGSDGRVSVVNANTTSGAFDPSKGQFAESMSIAGQPYTNAKGVRAVGVSSSLTARELAHRNALSNAINERSGANTDVAKILSQNGSAIGQIAVKHALAEGGNETYTETEIQPLKDAVDGMAAVATRIENSLKYYLLANSIGPAAAETTYVDLVNNITGAASLAAAEQVTGAVEPTDTDYTTAKTKLAELKANIATAQGIDNLTGNAITWGQLSAHLNVLVNMDNITVNGMTMDNIQNGTYEKPGTTTGETRDGKSELIDRVQKNDFTAEIIMPTGSGVFADVADLTGNYSSSFKMPVSYSGIDIEANTNMHAQTTYNPALLSAITVNEFVGDASGASGNPISTYYGYILDLAFRTNAKDSHLKLQAEAIDRIYSDGTNSETMGHGANMKFKTDSATFGQGGVKDLMEHVRIVFFNTSDNAIIAYAKLDAANSVNEGDYVVMPIVLTQDDASTTAVDNFEVAKTGDEADKIMDLPQNEAKALSVLVYLDGTTMTNADVAADAAQSMYGSMNLQFASSAALDPMDYTDLKTDGNGTGTTSYSPLNGISAPNGYTYRAYTDGSKIGFSLTPPSGTSLDSATVKVEIVTGVEGTTETKTDPIAATAGKMGALEGYVVSIPDGVTVDSTTKIYITVEGATTDSGTNATEATQATEATEATQGA